MADTFNHLHYLDQKLLEELPQQSRPLDRAHLADILSQMKTLFTDFHFVVSHGKDIVHADEQIAEHVQHQAHGVVLNLKHNKVVHLKFHGGEPRNEQLAPKPQQQVLQQAGEPYRANSWPDHPQEPVDLASTVNHSTQDTIVLHDSIFVQKDYGLQRTNYHMKLTTSGENEILFLSQHAGTQLFYSTMVFEVQGVLKSFSLQQQNLQKNKREMHYFLSSGAKLHHGSFSMVAPGQLQDDSVEVFHEALSQSKMDYESVCNGKVVSQINSVIPAHAQGCQTHQHISHLLLQEKAQAFSKPNLMIANPLVHASHGNSIGTIDGESLFYLQQRGIEPHRAKQMIASSKMQAFISQTSLANELLHYMLHAMEP